MLEINIKNTLVDRLEQVKEFSKLYEEYQKVIVNLITDIQANPKTEADHKDTVLKFRDYGMKVELMKQSISSLTNRLVELYTLIKISGIEIPLEDRDVNFLDGAMKNGSLDLFRVEKGELKVMNADYHDMVMQSITNITPEQHKATYDSLLTMKVE